jgi:hypothetical protein
LWEARNLRLPTKWAAPDDETQSVRRAPSVMRAFASAPTLRGGDVGTPARESNPAEATLRLVNEFRRLLTEAERLTAWLAGIRVPAVYTSPAMKS